MLTACVLPRRSFRRKLRCTPDLCRRRSGRFTSVSTRAATSRPTRCSRAFGCESAASPRRGATRDSSNWPGPSCTFKRADGHRRWLCCGAVWNTWRLARRGFRCWTCPGCVIGSPSGETSPTRGAIPGSLRFHPDSSHRCPERKRRVNHPRFMGRAVPGRAAAPRERIRGRGWASRTAVPVVAGRCGGEKAGLARLFNPESRCWPASRRRACCPAGSGATCTPG